MHDITRLVDSHTRDMLPTFQVTLVSTTTTTTTPSIIMYVLCCSRGRRDFAVCSANSHGSTWMHVPRRRTVRPTHCMSGPPPDRAPTRISTSHSGPRQRPQATPHEPALSLQYGVEADYAQCQTGTHWLPNCFPAQLWTRASFAHQNTVTSTEVG